MSKRILWAVVVAIASIGAPTIAAACGCFHQPEPPPTVDGDFAVNQNAEQIIFEVNDNGTITAHVSIKYEGDPAKFGWLVPVPSPPELALSDGLLFSILDQFTAPVVDPVDVSACPTQKYSCITHDACPEPRSYNNADAGGDQSGFFNNFNNANNSVGGGGEPVEVISREQIGSYDTVTFAANEAAAAVTWLETNGFIVNETMAPFLQPYLDAGMFIVASRLVPGAGVDEIRPLKMTYNGDKPMIPLQLTAIAAQPELTVTAFVMGDQGYKPVDQKMLEVSELTPHLSQFESRVNYPMVLSRVIDEAGADGAFVREYSNYSLDVIDPAFQDCCMGGDDLCGVGGNGACECPNADYDQADCSSVVDLDEYEAAFATFLDLSQTHRFITRLTTRLSPHEMTYDPVFELNDSEVVQRLVSRPEVLNLLQCESRFVDAAATSAYQVIQLKNPCTTTYCGRGTCHATPDGSAAMCVCPAGYVSQQFTDLDGLASVTCVPNVEIVDLSAGGITLPDACKGRDCGNGSCVDIQGFATCACDAGQAATVSAGGALPSCEPAGSAADAGARNYSTELLNVQVCDPAPPVCAEGWWLSEFGGRRFEGTECTEIAPERMQPTPAPVCRYDEDGNPIGEKAESGGCSQAGSVAPGAGFLVLLLGLFGVARRRRS